MRKIYYPDLKQKKKCMKICAKKAPEYKSIMRRVRILAIVCPIIGFSIDIYMICFADYWELVNHGFGRFYEFISTMLIVLCPMVALATWNKRFYNCCEEIFMSQYKTFEQTDEGIKFLCHLSESYASACNEEKEAHHESMRISKYPYDIIRGMKYDPDTQVVTITGAVVFEKYWDYEKGIKDESPQWISYDDTEMEFLLCFDERNEFLDYLYEQIKDTVWVKIEKTW